MRFMEALDSFLIRREEKERPFIQGKCPGFLLLHH
jgi:hypothetical protein